MDVREKLVELCEDVILSCKSSLCNDCEHNGIDYPKCMGVHFADHLISHGVTVQEWISVKDRLPKHFEHVLVNIPGDKPFNTVHEGYLEKDGMWNIQWYRCDPEDVTHWMPLPQPPKGE